ncbi:hypothetical protein CEP54_003864 [Fusarium duplospermum]|uniref:BTB domain-containing protein n=1 Tax=Fusarium duplospermum TaxID=1325734 RepID=A0A428QLX5_9HYPO|nr:hypothetical protein CEP54_003864 [Fusarium duplospermum]
MINKHPEFAAQFENGERRVDNIPPGAAHIVANYIYTDQYLGLRVTSPHTIDQTKHDFKMAVHVCALADKLCLPQLENLANQEVMALTPNLRLGIVIDLLDSKEFYQTPICAWLREYMSQQLLPVGRNSTEDLVRAIPDTMKKN